jgi:hypothetical protein
MDRGNDRCLLEREGNVGREQAADHGTRPRRTGIAGVGPRCRAREPVGQGVG